MVSIFFHTFVLLGCLVAYVLCQSQSEIGKRIEAAQRKIVESVSMSYTNYHLYPFALTTNKHQFLVNFQHEQIVKGEMNVLWIDNNDVKFPEYQKQEYIEIKIVDQTTNGVILEKKFYFQSGIKFDAQPKHSYRLIFKNSGKVGKMVQFALSYVEPYKLSSMTNTSNIIQEASVKAQTIVEEISNIFMKTQQELIIGQNLHSNVKQNMKHYFLSCVWQILLVCALVGTQVYLFKNVLQDNFII